MARRAAAALLTLSVLALGACTDDVATTPDEPHDLAPSRPPVDEPLVTVDTYPAVVNPAVVETAGARTVTLDDAGREVHATYPQFGHDALDEHLASAAEDTVAEYLDAPDPQELNQTWSVVGSGESVIGVLTETFIAGEGSVRETWSTSWYDPGAATLMPNSALVDDPEALDAEVTEALADQGSVDPSVLEEVLVAGAPVFAFTENGELFIGFDEFSIAPANTGRINVTLPLEATDDLLSDFGTRAQEALTGPSELPLPPGTTASPEESEPTDAIPPEGATTAPVDCAATACVALAFDGGPAATTPALLDALDEAEVSATFFAVGQQIATFPSATAEIAGHGHELGVHTWSHRNLTRLPLPDLDSEITRTIEALEEAAGVTPTLLRPPYGASDDAVVRRATEAGLTVVAAPPLDNDGPIATADELVAAALEDARAGGVVTLPGESPQAVAAVPDLVEALLAEGLTIVTVSELTPPTED